MATQGSWRSYTPYHIDIPSGRSDLPDGYSYGAHTGSATRGGAGWSGYYLIRDSDSAWCVARERPDIDEMPTASEIDAAMEKAE